jgi:hypothetical protein
MKSLTFNRKSWHFEFAEAGGYWPDKDDDGNYVGDICEYTKAIFKFLLVFVFCCIGFYLLVTPFVHAFLGIVFSLMYGTLIMTELGFIGCILAASLAITSIAYVIIIYVTERKYKVSTKPDGFIKHAFKSWKEKYCARITFTE